MPSDPEVDDVRTLVGRLTAGEDPRGWRLQQLDLRDDPDAAAARAALEAHRDLRGLVVLGGRLPADLAARLVAAGAIVFPAAHDAPVDPYRARLYTAEELYAGLDRSYAATPDGRAYAWSRDDTLTRDAYPAALRALHDASIADALCEALAPDGAAASPGVVGVMGGHAAVRGGDDYARAATLGAALAREGVVVLSGGGPGAMEAVNLGALAGAVGADDAHTARLLQDALARLATVPTYEQDVAAWARLGLAVRDGLLGAAAAPPPLRSVGVPTWFYGHEPPNVFAQLIAKFFANAVREDLLLAHSSAGVIVLPGAAGTVQEIFQAVTPRYYGGERPAPLILVGVEHWTVTVPVWPAVQALAQGRTMAAAVHLVDTPTQAAALLHSPANPS